MAGLSERVLRFDTIVSVCALLISTIATGAVVYQTWVIQEQFSAASWPYLSVDSSRPRTSLEISVVNDGAGPALMSRRAKSVPAFEVRA